MASEFDKLIGEFQRQAKLTREPATQHLPYQKFFFTNLDTNNTLTLQGNLVIQNARTASRAIYGLKHDREMRRKIPRLLYLKLRATPMRSNKDVKDPVVKKDGPHGSQRPTEITQAIPDKKEMSNNSVQQAQPVQQTMNF